MSSAFAGCFLHVFGCHWVCTGRGEARSLGKAEPHPARRRGRGWWCKPRAGAGSAPGWCKPRAGAGSAPVIVRGLYTSLHERAVWLDAGSEAGFALRTPWASSVRLLSCVDMTEGWSPLCFSLNYGCVRAAQTDL